VLAAAERNGALLVVLENLYGYGPTAARPMTEDLPLAVTGVKGTTRATMTAELLAAADAGRVRIAIGRASDFFGPGVPEGSVLGERVLGNALVGRRADSIGNPDLPHTYSYVPDIAGRRSRTRRFSAACDRRHCVPMRVSVAGWRKAPGRVRGRPGRAGSWRRGRGWRAGRSRRSCADRVCLPAAWIDSRE